MSLIMGIAPIIGVSIRNAELYDAQATQFSSTLQALAASIDARDPLTAGHSMQVTEYAVGIARELGFPRDFREMIRVAALLHDYGKIGVPDAILKKEGRLTPEEYETVKTHSSKTREILEQINFQGIYRQVPEIAGAHHEKIDGSGYPDGLKGKDIPIGARIIAVADFFEAVTSKRHYRDPMPLEEAFRLLREGSGQHFDRWIVSAFIRYYLREFGHRDGGVQGVVTREGGGAALRQAAPRESAQQGGMVFPTPMTDRCAVRVPCDLPVEIHLSNQRLAAKTSDISISGMYVAADCSMSIGSEVVLAFALPGREMAPVEVTGRVAWVNPVSRRRKPAYPPGFGVEFTGVAGTGVEEMKGFIRKLRYEEPKVASA
jgi:putative nucleotidyltransferase with HDIG domain